MKRIMFTISVLAVILNTMCFVKNFNEGDYATSFAFLLLAIVCCDNAYVKVNTGKK